MSKSKWTETSQRIIPKSSYPRILYTRNEDIALPLAPSPLMAWISLKMSEQVVNIFEDIITPVESPVVSEQADAVMPVYFPALSRSKKLFLKRSQDFYNFKTTHIFFIFKNMQPATLFFIRTFLLVWIVVLSNGTIRGKSWCLYFQPEAVFNLILVTIILSKYGMFGGPFEL